MQAVLSAVIIVLVALVIFAPREPEYYLDIVRNDLHIVVLISVLLGFVALNILSYALGIRAWIRQQRIKSSKARYVLIRGVWINQKGDKHGI